LKGGQIERVGRPEQSRTRRLHFDSGNTGRSQVAETEGPESSINQRQKKVKEVKNPGQAKLGSPVQGNHQTRKNSGARKDHLQKKRGQDFPHEWTENRSADTKEGLCGWGVCNQKKRVAKFLEGGNERGVTIFRKEGEGPTGFQIRLRGGKGGRITARANAIFHTEGGAEETRGPKRSRKDGGGEVLNLKLATHRE